MGRMGRTVRLGKLLQESPAWNRRFAFNSALRRLGPFNWPPTFAAIIPCHPFFQGTSSSEDTGLFAQGVLGSSILRLTGGISKRSINRSWINPKTRLHKCNILSFFGATVASLAVVWGNHGVILINKTYSTAFWGFDCPTQIFMQIWPLRPVFALSITHVIYHRLEDNPHFLQGNVLLVWVTTRLWLPCFPWRHLICKDSNSGFMLTLTI